MPIPIPCPSCGAVWPATEEMLGRAVKCPSCRYPLPVPDPPTQEFQEREFRYHSGAVMAAVLGFGALLLLGLYLAYIGQYLAAGLAVFPGVIGLVLNVRRLLSTGPALVLTSEGIVHGPAGKEECLPWSTIQGVRLEIQREPNYEIILLERLVVAHEPTPGQTAEILIDVKGLDLDGHGIARVVMQQVIRFNPRVQVQLHESTAINPLGLRLDPPA